MAPKKESLAIRNLVKSRIQETFDLAQITMADHSKIALFKIKYNLLAQNYEEFQAAHIQIISQLPDADLEAQDIIRKEVDDLYCQTLAIFEELCPATSPTPGGEVLAPSPTLSLSQSTPLLNVRLPKLELCKFSGDLDKWQTFIDIFDSSVHNCTQITDINKFQYLIASLIGEPLTLIKSIPLTAANYDLAYQTLVKRYANKRLLTLHHWHTIKNYPPINTDNFKALRQLVDTFSENIAILGNLNCNVKEWDFVLTDLLLDKLDAATRKRFELSSDATVMPRFEDLKEFLLKQCIALETVGSSKSTVLNSPSQRKYRSDSYQNPGFRPSNMSKGPVPSRTFVVSTPNIDSSITHQTSSSQSPSCPLCKMNHFLYRCSSFMAMSPSDRFQAVKQANLCVNCLRKYHPVVNCQSQHSCRTCGSKHHSLLHFNQARSSTSTETSTHNYNSPQRVQPIQGDSTPSISSATGVNACTSVSSISGSPGTTVLLSTVSLEIKNKWGKFCTIRALLDPGSQASFIVDASVKQVGLPRSRGHIPIFGLGQATPNSSGGVTTCQIRPHGSQQAPLELDALIIQSICSNLPNVPIDLSQLERFHNLPLADPLCHKPGPIHMLLGADIYPLLVTGYTITNAKAPGPMAIDTIFGWTLLGPINNRLPSAIRSFFVATKPCFDDILKKFWEVEEVPSKPLTSSEDHVVETLFQQSHFRTSSGRFGIALPFKILSPHFENSRAIADRRLLALENRLKSQPSLNTLYIDFMQDYLSSGHMSPVHPCPNSQDTYFIPHHGVLTTEGNKQKIRVVFDASAKAANNLSLNDTLYPGPKLQSDISTVLLRFRFHKVVFTCDIRQMYRQILVAPEHRKYQLIRWRFCPTDSIQTYQLNTVTYGINASPYLAIRTLLQLAEEGSKQFPLASKALQNDIYVDDLVCGASSVENALQLKDQLISLLQSGGFELRKWSSNHSLILTNIPVSHQQQKCFTFDSDSDATVKVLGLQWHSNSDNFSFQVSTRESPCTKRTILSEVARIYDPLGFLSPLTLFAKRLLQRLWSLGLDWDDCPPADVLKVWSQYKVEISCLNSLRIPRNLFEIPVQSCQLHAFCDASESGYACVTYFRITDEHNQVSTRFIIAKSKVAPLRRLSIPRLELCAAVLLAKLVDFIVNIYQPILTLDSIVAWSDSTVALTWIRSSPHRWKSFVGNRTSFIQERVAPSCWRYIPSKENPADPASRGLLPTDLLSCSLWWAAPTFLQESSDRWPSDFPMPSPDANVEEKSITLVAQVVPSNIATLLKKFSSLRKIQRIVSYLFRFINNAKRQTRISGPLSVEELHRALLHIVKAVQSESFSDEISAVRHKGVCPRYLQKLAPFLDTDGILRVGGRLGNSDLTFSVKHPALLPRNHRITELIILQIHNDNLHPGINTTMYLLQQNFWVLSTRRAIRHYLSKCNRCFRAKPISYAPPMGNLPKSRISQVKPFSCVGVDYAGPFTITLGKTRGAKSQKAYLCLFICFATKAIHLELASDLSTEAFLGALRRFIARRGRCSQIFSDCGSNFVGANTDLTKYMQTSAETEHITWTFNPPSAPHFGGLWESGVKSAKTHFYRVIGNQILTYEELNTLFIQIESLLNSRPLCSLSSDPNDLNVLTPGHFLTLEPLTSAPDPDLSHLAINRLSRWQLVQHMHQNFWNRWKNEYLHNLYQKSKWSKSHLFKPANVGTLVLIKDPLAPPLKWRIGRIVELFPGTDGISRVASVLTAQGTFKRPLVRLCALPSQ